MRYYYSIIFFFFAILLFLSIFPSISIADPSIIITDYQLTPSILMPGDKAILSLTIYNAESTATTTTTSTYTSGSYTSSTSNVKVNGATLNNIRISSASDGTNQVKGLVTYSSVAFLAGGGSLNIDFEIMADKNISEGSYFPKVIIDLEESDYQDVSYPITVKVSNATVDLLSANIPSDISIGGSTDITLTVINNRDNTVKKVTVIPEKINGIRFIPESVYIGELESDSSQNIIFSVEPNQIGVKNLSFEVSYKNGDNLHNNTLDISIEVVETHDVAPVLYYVPSTIGKGKSSRIRLEVYNAKTESISGVIVTPITDVKISPSQYFIGSMDPDDVFSASFDVYTDELEIGSNYTIDFKVSFKQGDNYYETPVVSSSFKVIKAEEGDGIQTIIYISIPIVILILIYFVIYVRKKRRISRWMMDM